MRIYSYYILFLEYDIRVHMYLDGTYKVSFLKFDINPILSSLVKRSYQY